MEAERNSRCPWCGNDPLYVRYHDEEWGRPVTDDRTLFEFLTLESAQAGLAWITILRKRDGYREAFHDFDYREVGRMTEADEERLRSFDGIVKKSRHQYLSTKKDGNGMGLLSISITVEKYHGVARFYHSDSEFYSEIMLNMP